MFNRNRWRDSISNTGLEGNKEGKGDGTIMACGEMMLVGWEVVVRV